MLISGSGSSPKYFVTPVVGSLIEDAFSYHLWEDVLLAYFALMGRWAGTRASAFLIRQLGFLCAFSLGGIFIFVFIFLIFPFNNIAPFFGSLTPASIMLCGSRRFPSVSPRVLTPDYVWSMLCLVLLARSRSCLSFSPSPIRWQGGLFDHLV